MQKTSAYVGRYAPILWGYGKVTNYPLYYRRKHSIETIVVKQAGRSLLPASFDMTNEDAAIAALLTRLNDKVGMAVRAGVDKASALAFVAIAERKKSLETIATLSSSVATSVWRLMQFRHFSYKQLLDSVGDTWLLARYGLRPMAYEIAGIANGLLHAMDKSIWTPVRKYKQEQIVVNSRTMTVPLTLNTSNVGTLQYYVRSTVRIKVSMGCHWNVHSASYGGLYQELGGLKILTTAVELVPLSFMLGWISNFNDLIASLDMSPNVNLTSRFRTTTTTIKRELIVLNLAENEGFGLWQNPPRLVHLATHTSRTPLAEFTKYAIPALEWNVDLPKILDFGFIMRNIFSSNGKPKKYRF